MSLLTSLLNHYSMSFEDLRRRSSARSFVDLKRPENDVLTPFTNLIRQAKDEKAKVVIYGDYDVDGLTSTAILKTAMDEYGLECGFFIPSRYVEGYGLTQERIKQFSQKGYKYLIAVDNGITCFDQIEYAKSLGFTTIVIDHHQKQEKLPGADFIFHQDMFVDYNCSAASLAYFASSQLLGRDDEYLAVLAGLAVFSDVMPLVGNNLVFARMALDFINRNRYRNMSLLLDKYPATYEDLSYSIIAKLNAVGRVRSDSISTNNACRFLLDRDGTKGYLRYVGDIRDANEEKKKELKEPSFDSHVFETDTFIGVRYEGKSGLTGLLANRLLNEKKKTACVFALDPKDDNVLVCSIRANEDYSLNDFCKKHENVFLTYGGHSKAMGFSIPKEKMDLVCVDLAMWIMSKSFGIKKKDESIQLIKEDLSLENTEVYERFEPFGEGFPAPLFSLTVSKDSLFLSKNETSVLVKDHNRILAFYFNDTSLMDKDFEYVTFTGKLRIDSYANTKSLRLIAEKAETE